MKQNKLKQIIGPKKMMNNVEYRQIKMIILFGLDQKSQVKPDNF